VGVRGRLPVGVRSPDPLAALVCQDCPMAPGLAGRYGAGCMSGFPGKLPVAQSLMIRSERSMWRSGELGG
jgi:hypothetical protein